MNSQPITSQSIWLNAPAIFRALAFFAVWLVCWLPIAFPVAKSVKWRFPQPVSPSQKLPLLASLYALAPLVLWGIASLEKGSFANYGLPLNWGILRSFAIGLGLGSLGLLSLFLLEWAAGWITWKLPDSPRTAAKTKAIETKAIETEAIGTETADLPPIKVLPTLLTTLLIATWIGLTEELIFRGFLLTTLEQDFSPWVAATIASLIFAVLHLVWEGRENIPQLPGLFLMGMVLVLARWVDQGNLGLAWGLHAGWIWVMASLDTLGVIHYRDRISPWVTGLDNKPLAGIMGLLFLLVTGGVVGMAFQG